MTLAAAARSLRGTPSKRAVRASVKSGGSCMKPAENLEDPAMSDAQTRIADDVKNNDVLLYMKGTPAFPQCGFSSVVVQILSHVGVKFKAVNVLEDPEVREGIKSFSNWPTIPQLYVKGEFVGGADIVREMFEQEELVPFFQQHGVALEPA